jgi:hypothetical protein
MSFLTSLSLFLRLDKFKQLVEKRIRATVIVFTIFYLALALFSFTLFVSSLFFFIWGASEGAVRVR